MLEVGVAASQTMCCRKKPFRDRSVNKKNVIFIGVWKKKDTRHVIITKV